MSRKGEAVVTENKLRVSEKSFLSVITDRKNSLSFDIYFHLDIIIANERSLVIADVLR